MPRVRPREVPEEQSKAVAASGGHSRGHDPGDPCSYASEKYSGRVEAGEDLMRISIGDSVVVERLGK